MPERPEPIRHIEGLSEADLSLSDEALLRLLGGPTSIRIAGEDRTRTRAVTTLLHGNEPSGTRAIFSWMRTGSTPAVDVLFYFGSVGAALEPPPFSRRAARGHRDANRCFTPPYHGEDGAIAGALLDLLSATEPEVLVDLHNNTGHSPAYGVGTRIDPIRLALTSLFADTYVCTDLHLGTLVEATETRFPGVVIECGRAGDPVADAVALAGLDRLLSVPEIARDGVRSDRMRILDHPIRVRLRDHIAVSFGADPDPHVDLTVRRDIDRHNFEVLAPGTVVGWLGPARSWPFDARGQDGVEVSHDLFEQHVGALRSRGSLIPIMMTGNAEIARRDCLFYVVFPKPPHEA